MSRARVLGRVARLREMRGDWEAAHAEEDSLWRAVLEAIRDGADDPTGLASAALRTVEIAFPRHCA